MALASDLLEQAYHLARREPKRPRQASLRRAVSTSYYALFHLLISEATLNWRQSSQRAALGRYFQHGSMAKASDKQKADCNRFLTSIPPPAPGKSVPPPGKSVPPPRVTPARGTAKASK